MTQFHPQIQAEHLLDDATVSRKLHEHEQLTARLLSEIASLPDEQKDQWVGINTDHILFFGDDLRDLIARLRSGKPADTTVVVQYVSADPIVMIL